MKRLFLVIMMTVFVTGCVYSERRSPYGYSSGYSSYSTVTPVYPRYEERYYRSVPQPRYVVPAKPFFRAYDDHHDHEHHSNHRSYRERDESHERHEHDDHDGRSNSRSHRRW